MKTSEPTVFLVDDDVRIRQSFQFLAESIGLKVESFASADDFLEAYTPDRSGCLVLDVRMPKTSGLELQDRLLELQIHIPIIFVSGHADVRMAARAFRAGAFDFVEKPVNNQELLERIQEAIDRDEQRRKEESLDTNIELKFARLTPKEREVLELVVDGKSIKQIATCLAVSHQTVAKHHIRMLEKMEVNNAVELVNLLNSRRQNSDR